MTIEVQTCIGVVYESLRCCAILLQPVVPTIADIVLNRLQLRFGPNLELDFMQCSIFTLKQLYLNIYTELIVLNRLQLSPIMNSILFSQHIYTEMVG